MATFYCLARVVYVLCFRLKLNERFSCVTSNQTNYELRCHRIMILLFRLSKGHHPILITLPLMPPPEKKTKPEQRIQLPTIMEYDDGKKKTKIGIEI